VANEGVWIPDGYQRDPDGRWRYRDDGTYVPGARDLTLASLWRFVIDGEHVLVRTSAILADPTLSWCRSWSDGTTYVPGRRGRHGYEALKVDRDEWELRRNEVIGVIAPELALNRLIGVRDVARIMGVEESTVRAYLTRGYLPASALREPLGPAWSLPVILKRLEQRTGQGRKTVTRAKGLKRSERTGETSTWRWSFEDDLDGDRDGDPDEGLDGELQGELERGASTSDGDGGAETNARDAEFREWMKHIDTLRRK
jgi:hypothetical protein